MRKKIIPIKILLPLFLITNSFLFSQTKVIPYQQLPTSSGASTGSGMYFGAIMTTSGFTISFEGPSDRWIALGIGSSMNPADALIYSNGHAASVHPLGWYDYYINSYSSSGVLSDATQNWNVISTATASGQRTVVASRSLNTGDASDVAISFTSTVLNLVWARGASADYTIAYHGSTNRANGISLTWLSTPTASFATFTTTLCAGSSVTYSNLTSGGLTSYTWAFQGGNPATSTSTNPVVSYSVPGTYSVVLTATNAIGTDTYTQINYITVTPTIATSVSISLASGNNPICAGSLATFSASPINGGTSPIYLWKVNGINAGINSSTFTTTTLTNPSTVTCVMTSNAVCPNPGSITSAPITMTVNSNAPASVSIALVSGNNPLCNGATISYTASAGNGGSSPIYQWKINGVNVGTNSSTFATNTLSNNDIVTCQLTSNAVCASSLIGISSGITMSVSSILNPSVTLIISSGSNPLCAGSLINFSVTPLNGGVTPLYQWKINGLNAGINSPTFTSTTLNNGEIVTCIMTSGLSCASPPTATSSAINVTVNPIPALPVITPSGTIGLCSGNSLTLTSSASSGNLWSNSSTSQVVVISSIGNYTVTQTLNGCTSPPSAPVSVTANPQPTASILPAGPFCNDSGTVTLLGTPAGGSFNGSSISGNVFNPSSALTGSNIVVYNYSDSNNCIATASTTIVVSDCTGLKINNGEGHSVNIFPNPTAGLINIKSVDEKIISISITDTQGKVLLKKYFNYENTATIDISKEQPDIYILRIGFEKSIVSVRITKKD